MADKCLLETSCVVTLPIEEYNELRHAEVYRRLSEEGYLEIEVICFKDSIRLCVSDTTTLGQIAAAAGFLMNKQWKFFTLTGKDGWLYELPRTLEASDIHFGDKLYLGWSNGDGKT